HETPKLLIRLGGMRHQDQLVNGVKSHQISHIPPSAQQLTQPPVGEYPLDEVLPKPWIRQAAFFLHGQIRKTLHQPHRKSSASSLPGNAVFVRDRDPLQSAARGVLLEDESHSSSAASASTLRSA